MAVSSIIFSILAQDKASREITRVGDAAETTGAKVKKHLGENLKTALAGLGAGAGISLAAGLLGSLDVQSANAKLTAQLGLTAPESARIGKVAGDLYAHNYGDSLGNVNDAIRSVIQDVGGMGTASSDVLQDISAKTLSVAGTFDQDLGGVTRAVGQLMRTGLAPDAQAALDIVTRGFQTGADKSGDFLDTLNEYGTQFRKLGIDGVAATGLISQGLQAGARDGDLVADALKEFSIRAIDGSKATADAFMGLGLSADTFRQKIAAGGPAAKEALGVVLDRLRSVQDPAERAALATGLFGTQAEDLGQALFALHPETAATGLGKVAGAVTDLDKTVGNTAAGNLESFKRQLTGAFVTVMGGQVLPALSDVASTLATGFGPALAFAGDHTTLLKVALGGAGVVLGTVATATAVLTVAAKAQAAMAFVQTASTYGLSYALAAGGTAAKVYAAAQLLLNAAMTANPIGLIVVGVAALTAGLVLAYRNSETFRNIVAGAFDFVAASIGVVVKVMGGLLGALGALGVGPAAQASEALKRVGDELFAVGTKTDAATSSTALLEGTLDGAIGSAGEYAVTANVASTATSAFTTVQGALTDKTVTLEDKVKTLTTGLDALIGGFVDSNDATSNYEAALDALAVVTVDATGKNKGHNNSLDLGTEAGRKNQAALDAVAKSLVAKAGKDYEATGSGKGLTTTLNAGRDALIAQGTKAGFTKDQMQKLIDKYNLTPKDIDTLVQAKGVDAAKAGIQSVHDKAANLKDTEFRVSALARVGSRSANDELAALAGVAGGGQIHGPGTGTSDSILGVNARGVPMARVSAGEWVIKKATVDKYGPAMMAAINEGKLLAHGGLLALARGGAVGYDLTAQLAAAGVQTASVGIQRFYGAVIDKVAAIAQKAAAAAEGGGTATAGGQDAIRSFIRSTDPLPYIWGAVGPRGYDCSGLTSEVYARHRGLPHYRRYFTTGSFPGSSRGWSPGRGGTYSVGLTAGSGHMAGEYGGLKFEAASTASGIKVGSAARSVSTFARQYHMATGGEVRAMKGINALTDVLDIAGDSSELVWRKLAGRTGVRQYAAGGVITEPVAGVGRNTGRAYTFAERGPETVTPGVKKGRELNLHYHGDFYSYDPTAVDRERQKNERDAMAVYQLQGGVV